MINFFIIRTWQNSVYFSMMKAHMKSCAMVIPLLLLRFVFCFFKCVVRLFDEVKQSKIVKMSLKTLGSTNVKNK